MVALAAPALVGAKATVNVVLPPAATVGVGAPPIINSALELETLTPVMAAVPVFDIVTSCVAEVVPTC
jgi:hypothetical protein